MNSVLAHDKAAVEALEPGNANAIGRALGIVSVPGYKKLNNVTIPAIRNGILPLLLLDTFLHVSEPTRTAPGMPRASERPTTEAHHQAVRVLGVAACSRMAWLIFFRMRTVFYALVVVVPFADRWIRHLPQGQGGQSEVYQTSGPRRLR